MNKNNNKKAESAGKKTPSFANYVSSKKEQEKKTLAITPKASWLIALTTTLIIALLGAFFLIEQNSDVLFMAQNRSFFTTNAVFLVECMKVPGGFANWIASFLNQFFYHPALGATIMIFMWIASMWLSKIAFKVKLEWMAVLAIPAVCLLVSTIDTGYWIYYIKQIGYWFYGTTGFLFSMIAVFVYFLFRKRTDYILASIFIAFTYPFFGWYTILALIYIAAAALVRNSKEEAIADRILIPILPLAFVAIVPLLSYFLYPELRLKDAWIAGFPYFTNDKVVSIIPAIPFIIMAVTPLIFPFLPKHEVFKGKAAWTVYLTSAAILVASCIWIVKSNFQNHNYHAEIRMYCAAEEQEWDKVLEEMTGLPGDASRQMVLIKNIALLNKGEMGTKMFKYNNMGEAPSNGFDTLNIHMVQTAAPLIYYYHGKTNFASRWCIENSVEFGYNFNNLKMLTRCAIINKETDLAKKYLDVLKTSIYHKEWAESMTPIIENPQLVADHKEYALVYELWSNMGSVLDGDNGLCEMYLLNYFSNTMNKDCKPLQELTLNYAMVQKDIKLFWPRFFLYAQLHKDEKMPTHYQEAAYLYGHLEPQNVNITKMPFDKNVVDRYNGFQQLSQSLLSSGMKTQAVGEAMKSSYGDTFYWFYFFCRDIRSY